MDDIEAEKKKEFEDGLNKFLAPYKKNAEKTGYLFGDSITIADIVMIMRCTMCRYRNLSLVMDHKLQY